MKKIMMLILGVLLFIPAIALADMGAPGVREYKVTPKSEEGAGIYRITYEGDKATVEKAGTVPYGKEISIMQEFEIDGILYGDYYDSDYDVHHIKLSEFKAVGKNAEKDEAIYAARVFAENGLELYEGPGSAYEKTGKTVAKGTLVAASEYIGYGTWVYIESGDIKGYVNAEKGGLGVLYRRPIMDTETNKEYSEYYKTHRGYHKRSLNSNGGWAIQTNTSMMNTRLFRYSNEIRSAVMIVHGENAHSCYMGKDAYNDMIKDSKYTSNKKLLIIPNANHTDLYDQKDKIPFDKIEEFMKEYLNNEKDSI